MSDFPTTPLPGSTPEPSNTDVSPDSAPDSQPTVPLNTNAAAPTAQPTVPHNTNATTAQPTVPLNTNATTAQPTVPHNTNTTTAQPTVPLNTDAWASVSQAAPVAPGAASAPRRNRPRFSTILWGVLLLVFAGFMVAWTVLPTAPDPTLLLIGAVIAIGVALVAAGIAAASRRAG
ncbi:hypothetical protein GCM10022381_24080 [Leifsonia kafniensis]|uniref:DUF308 domain-containing protein n=1 Tax=Leifsonia kafniensis TaxID=475957 RepID=A0ABP7KKL0_9MICO